MQSSICAFTLIEFARSPASFLDAVLLSPELEHIRDGLVTGRHPVVLYNGAKLLVAPEDAATVLEYMSTKGVPLDEGGASLMLEDLKQRHLLVGMDFEDVVVQTVSSAIGSGRNGGNGRDKMKVKRRQSVMLM